MELQQGELKLRDMRKEDLVDYIRWVTRDVDWREWDAPWQTVGLDFVERRSRRLTRPLPEIRTSLEIDYCGQHIGWVTSYRPAERVFDIAVGISMPRRINWGHSLGFMSLALWISYLFANRPDASRILCETWSGNSRMIRLAYKLGFVELNRIHASVAVHGSSYDEVVYMVDRSSFQKSLVNALPPKYNGDDSRKKG